MATESVSPTLSEGIENKSWTFDEAVKSILSVRKQSLEDILDSNKNGTTKEPLIKPGKSIKIGKHCTKVLGSKFMIFFETCTALVGRY